MNKKEFLERLENKLKQNNISDATDILGEYEQHFSFKLADGFSEEEIAAKLGDPAGIAAQFSASAKIKGRAGTKAVAVIGLCFTDLAAGMFFVLLAAWGIVLAAFSLCSAVAAVSLVAGLRPLSLIPPMPYVSAVIFGVAMVALAVLSAVGCVWFVAFLRQMTRVYGRFHHNTMAAASGAPVLPSIALYPSFQPKARRRLRRVVLMSLSLFAASCILGMVVSMLCAGSLEFWHTWGWFGYTQRI